MVGEVVSSSLEGGGLGGGAYPLGIRKKVWDLRDCNYLLFLVLSSSSCIGIFGRGNGTAFCQRC